METLGKSHFGDPIPLYTQIHIGIDWLRMAYIYTTIATYVGLVLV